MRKLAIAAMGFWLHLASGICRDARRKDKGQDGGDEGESEINE